MEIIEKWKRKREIKKILNSKDVEKVESVEDFEKDENLENIILSIKDKNKRAQALQKAIHKIDDKEIIKSILPTLKDDDILRLLDKKIEYLDNADRNILYTTISSINDDEKRLSTIKRFYKHLSDTELANTLESIKDKNLLIKKGKKNKRKQADVEGMESEVENHKINIITNKIILNYINNETLLHMRELLGCLQLDTSKVKVVEKALEQEEKLQEKIKRGELPKEYEKKDEKGNLYVIKNTVFDEKGKKLLIRKSFESIKGGKSVERRKKEILIKLYKEGLYTYEEARTISKTLIYNDIIEKEAKENLLKIEGRKKFVQEVKEKDLINTPITIEKTGNIVEIPDDEEKNR